MDCRFRLLVGLAVALKEGGFEGMGGTPLDELLKTLRGDSGLGLALPL